MEPRHKKKLRPLGRRDPLRPSRIGRRILAYRLARLERRHILPPRIAVPSFFTLLNLLSGFLAIVQISEGRPVYAAWLIVLAGFFDLLDGLMARLTDSESAFGIELDSLADVISFGVAPSFMVYQMGLKEFGALGLLVASLPALCGAVRLARYNVFAESEKKDHFEGMPIPAQAAALVSFLLVFDESEWFAAFVGGRLSVLIPLVVVLSTLMITGIRFETIPRPSRSYIKTHRFQAVAFAVSVLLVLFFQATGILITMIGYVSYALGRAIYTVARSLWEDDGHESDA